MALEVLFLGSNVYSISSKALMILPAELNVLNAHLPDIVLPGIWAGFKTYLPVRIMQGECK